MVAAGIFLGSKMAGLVRIRVFAHYFGLQSGALPTLLMLRSGSRTFSRTFLVKARSLLPLFLCTRVCSRKDKAKEADRVAGAVGALLGLIVAVLVLAGVLAAPLLGSVLALGFTGEKLELTIRIVRILFPGEDFS